MSRFKVTRKLKVTLQAHSKNSRSHFKVTRKLKVTFQGYISRLAPKVSS
ncbi:unnamed protein product [Acanthoscelides obtectus]|uniref:Uncharacterized protein n=1 Tax=Acanthoscelides obtectus TaxID=200917 RepID=A0A9P0PIM6_ACAOB|nr:unnamed protein product [Acanthoscelides obtectus]CAK1672049.1 hypothetical protein AOBTE_LOCUS28621 [Acanthoscelides obtectus]